MNTDPHGGRMLARVVLINLLGVAVGVAAYFRGWLEYLFGTDSSGMTYGIAGVFVIGLGMAMVRAWQVGAEMDAVRGHRAGQWHPKSRVAQFIEHTRAVDAALSADALKLKLASRVRMVRFLAESLVVLGLIGTVIGFIVALQAVEPDSAANIDAIGAMVAHLLSGMAIALNTTLLGACLGLWLGLNVSILQSATANLHAEIVLAGRGA